MSFSEEKRNEIKRYLLYKIDADDPDFIIKSQEIAGSSVTTIKNYLREAIAVGHIVEDSSAKCGYHLVDSIYEKSFKITPFSDETSIYHDEILPIITATHPLNENAQHIIDYCFLEILNNAIEHSSGQNVHVKITRNCIFTTIHIIDDGIGIYQSIINYYLAHGRSISESDALIDIYKGKFTTKSENHSGEGIFFSSKMADSFNIISGNTVYSSGAYYPNVISKSLLTSYFTKLGGIGTMVVMKVNNETNITTTDVFNNYSDADEGFTKTHIPVHAICDPIGPLARSQGRRICERLTDFKEAFIDFEGVNDMGQGFSDEIFRVYANAHPEVVLRPINANPTVIRMIKHVGRGHLAENVILPTV